MDGALARVRLSAAGFVMLLEIHREPPPTQEVLAARLSLGAGTVSEQLQRLAGSGLVRRNRARRGGAHAGLPPGGGAHAVPPAPVATLTARGVGVLSRAEEIAVRVERAWARRLAGREDPRSKGPIVGLRRWLTNSRAALAAQTAADG